MWISLILKTVDPFFSIAQGTTTSCPIRIFECHCFQIGDSWTFGHGVQAFVRLIWMLDPWFAVSAEMPGPRYFFLSSLFLLFIRGKVLVSVFWTGPMAFVLPVSCVLEHIRVWIQRGTWSFGLTPPAVQILTTSWKIPVSEFFGSTLEALGIVPPGIPDFFGVVNKGAKGARGAGPANTAHW